MAVALGAGGTKGNTTNKLAAPKLAWAVGTQVR